MVNRNETKNKDNTSIRSRRAIVNLLKQNGPMDAVALSSALTITGMAVRQHLYALQEEKLVDYDEEPRPMGRPAKLWKLTAEANRLFPSGYADLTVSLIESMREAFGDDGLQRLLAVRNRKQQEHYAATMSDISGIREKLDALAALRTQEGYMAEIVDQEDGSMLLVEKHCPICDAAASCMGFCENELNLFRTVLGDRVEVERVEHLLTGGTRCIYAVTNKRNG